MSCLAGRERERDVATFLFVLRPGLCPPRRECGPANRSGFSLLFPSKRMVAEITLDSFALILYYSAVGSCLLVVSLALPQISLALWGDK